MYWNHINIIYVNAFLTVHGGCQVDANLLFFQCHIGTMIPTLCAMRAPLGRDMLLGGLPALRWKSKSVLVRHWTLCVSAFVYIGSGAQSEHRGGWGDLRCHYHLDKAYNMGGNGGGKGNGGGQQPAQQAANGAEEAVGGFQRGLDSGLAKSAPSAVGLSQKTYRSYRRRLELFGRQCLRRGKETAVEGAYLVMSQLQDVAWDAAESIDYDDIELDADPFAPIKKVLDLLFQHEEEVELSERCQEFFEQFSRGKNEELQAYIVRHQSLLKKLKELQVEVPPLLAGWHMLSRAGVPRWTHPQVKALCGGDLNVKSVAKAMTRMFGGDSKPNAKDTVFRSTRDDLHYLDHYDCFHDEDDVQEVYYHNEEVDEWPEEEIMEEIDLIGCDDEEVALEIDEAAVAVEDAYINYLDSRKKMRELALARGFYPVVALDMGGGQGDSGKGRSKGSTKTGGKGKGKKGKGHGKGF